MHYYKPCTANYTMVSYFTLTQWGKPKKRLKKPMVELVSLPVRAKTFGPHKKTQLLLLKMIARYYGICKALPHLPRVCQFHTPIAKVSAYFLYKLAIWTWGMVLSGRLYWFILITDYFSKMVEAASRREVQMRDMVKFVKHHVIYFFGAPWRIIHDNGPKFASQGFSRLCNKFKIKCCLNSP